MSLEITIARPRWSGNVQLYAMGCALKANRRLNVEILRAGTQHAIRNRLTNGRCQIANAAVGLLGATRDGPLKGVTRAPGNAAATSEGAAVLALISVASGGTVATAIKARACAW